MFSRQKISVAHHLLEEVYHRCFQLRITVKILSKVIMLLCNIYVSSKFTKCHDEYVEQYG